MPRLRPGTHSPASGCENRYKEKGSVMTDRAIISALLALAAYASARKGQAEKPQEVGAVQAGGQKK